MRTTPRNLLQVGFLLFLFASFAGAAENVVAVITHRSVSLEAVTQEELSDLFLQQRHSVGGERLKPINLAEEELKLNFLSRLTGLPRPRIEDHFVRLELRGEGKWPPEVVDARELAKVVLVVRRVVGWLPVSALDALTADERATLKVLAVDGKQPGEEGYPLVH